MGEGLTMGEHMLKVDIGIITQYGNRGPQSAVSDGEFFWGCTVSTELLYSSVGNSRANSLRPKRLRFCAIFSENHTEKQVLCRP